MIWMIVRWALLVFNIWMFQSHLRSYAKDGDKWSLAGALAAIVAIGAIVFLILLG